MYKNTAFTLDVWEEIVGDLKDINTEENTITLTATYTVKLPKETIQQITAQQPIKKISILRTDKNYVYKIKP